MNLEQIKNSFDFVASREDDSVKYEMEMSKIKGKWKHEAVNMDVNIATNGMYMIIESFGRVKLYKRKI